MTRLGVVFVAAVGFALSGCSCSPPALTDGGTGGGGGGGSGGGTGGGGGAAAQFTLSTSPGSLTIGQGGTGMVNVSIDRSAGETGTISLTSSGAPTGVTAAFAPASVPGSASASVLTLTVQATAATGVTNLTITGTAASGTVSVNLPVTVSAPATVLLVDDDISENNQGTPNPTPSASDTLFNALLAGGAAYDVFVVPMGGTGPSAAQLAGYDTVVWYCGSQYGGGSNVNTLSSTDEGNLKTWLDQGGKKLVLFADEYFYGADSGANWTTVTNTFLGDYFGEQGIAKDKLNHQSYIATGAGDMAGLSLNVARDAPLDTYTSPANPKTGTDTLFTAMLDPDGNGTIAAAIATGRKNVGTAGTSKTMLFGFPLENVVDAGGNTKAAVFAKVLAY